MAKQRKTDHGARAPADDDALAFRAAVRDVKPLAHTPSAQGLAKPRSRTRRATPLIDIPSPAPIPYCFSVRACAPRSFAVCAAVSSPSKTNWTFMD